MFTSANSMPARRRPSFRRTQYPHQLVVYMVSIDGVLLDLVSVEVSTLRLLIGIPASVPDHTSADDPGNLSGVAGRIGE
jgi:hypothetical protein